VGGFFGVASKQDCLADLFYGPTITRTWHIPRRDGGARQARIQAQYPRYHQLAVSHEVRARSVQARRNMGLGVISDYEDQPMLVGSRHGAMRS